MDYRNVTNYLASMTIGQVLLDRKIIRKKDFLQFEKLMCEKYGLSPRSIFRDSHTFLQSSETGRYA